MSQDRYTHTLSNRRCGNTAGALPTDKASVSELADSHKGGTVPHDAILRWLAGSIEAFDPDVDSMRIVPDQCPMPHYTNPRHEELGRLVFERMKCNGQLAFGD